MTSHRDSLPGRPGYEVTQTSRFEGPDAEPTHCPRCKARLVTRNGEGRVVATLTLRDVDGRSVCEHCAKFIESDGAAVTHDAIQKTMRLQRYSSDASLITHASRARLERDRKLTAGGKCAVCGNWRALESCAMCDAKAKSDASSAALAAFPPRVSVAAPAEEKLKQPAEDPGELLGTGIPW